MATKRIIEQPEGTAASGDYVMTDSSTAGTKKVELVGMVDNAIDSALDDYEPADGSIDANMLADDAVTTPKLADNAVTKPKLSAALRNALGNVLRGTATGAVVSAHGTYAAPPLGLTVDGKSAQDGTPTPSAPVAIDSVESVAVKVNSKNLLPHPPALINTDGGVTFTDNGDGSYTINGTATKNTYIYVTRKGSGFALPAGTYTLSARSADGTMPSNLMVGASRWNGSTNTNYGSTKGGDFTFTHDGTGEVQTLVYVNKNYSVSNATVYPQLELGSSGTSYVPWTASSTPIDLQGHELRSLPDGTHDELTVDADGNVTLVQRVGGVTFNGSETWNLSGSGKRVYSNEYTHKRPAGLDTVYEAFSTHFVGVSTNATYAGTCGVSADPNGDSLQFANGDSSMTVNAWKTWLQSNNVTVWFELATPITHDLGTVTLPALPAPDMTAWAQTTPATTITLDYERDANMAIEEMGANIAPVEQAVATANHATGSLMMLGGKLVKATAAIAIGEAVTIGTNVVATTVAAELALKANA